MQSEHVCNTVEACITYCEPSEALLPSRFKNQMLSHCVSRSRYAVLLHVTSSRDADLWTFSSDMPLWDMALTESC